MINNIVNNALNFKGNYTLGDENKKHRIVQDIMQVGKSPRQQELIAGKIREYTDFCSSITPENEEGFINIELSPTGEGEEKAFVVENYPVINGKISDTAEYERREVISEEDGNFFEDAASRVIFALGRSMKNFELLVNKRKAKCEQQNQEEKLLSIIG